MYPFRYLRNVKVHDTALSLILFFGILCIGCCIAESPIDMIKRSCENNLDFKSIKEFVSFIRNYKLISEEQLQSADVSEECISDRSAILELEEIISKTDVCDSYRINELIKYHKKYFKPTHLLKFAKAITHNFFVKYAVQVAYVCKKNLIQNLEIAREELKAVHRTFEQARDKVYNEEPMIKSNIKLIEEQPDQPTSSNVRPKDEAELTISEYREALVKLQRPEDILTFEPEDCKGSKSRETLVSKDKVQIFFKPAMMCHQLHRYYAGSVLSIAKLANYGYSALDEELDTKLENEPTLRDWVIAVQVCEPMLYMNTKELRGDMAVIDTCSDKVQAIEDIVYDDSFEELDLELLGRLIPRSEATRKHSQKIMRSAYKRMAKIDIMKQLKLGAKRKSIFSKTLSMLKNQDVGSQFASSDLAIKNESRNKFTIQISEDVSAAVPADKLTQNYIKKDLTDDESFKVFKGYIEKKEQLKRPEEGDGFDQPVAFFDPMSSLATTLTVLAIMLSFEWLFFVVMALAARICAHLHFNFNNILTFPPKILSWSDADFASYNEKMEKMDEDDFFDYDELNPEERQQRDLLNQLFGRPPPMLYRE